MCLKPCLGLRAEKVMFHLFSAFWNTTPLGLFCAEPGCGLQTGFVCLSFSEGSMKQRFKAGSDSTLVVVESHAAALIMYLPLQPSGVPQNSGHL